jgi:hypothetical protein
VRMSTVLLTMLCAYAVSQQALATDPPAPSASATNARADPQGAKAPLGDKSAAAPTNAASPTPETPTVNPGLTVVGAKPELTPDEKELLSRGYRLEMRHGDKYFCRREAQIGSRFEIKNCATSDAILARRSESQDALRAIQNDRSQINK